MDPTPPKPEKPATHVLAKDYKVGEPVIYLGHNHGEVVEIDADQDLLWIGGDVVRFWISANVVQKYPRKLN